MAVTTRDVISIVVGDPVNPFTEEDVRNAERCLSVSDIHVECPYMETRHLAKINFTLRVCESNIIKALRGSGHPDFTHRRDLT
jgi:hypothetical protein